MPSVQSTGTEILQNDIRTPSQLAKDFLTTRMVEIQGDRSFIPVNAEKRRATIQLRRIGYARSKRTTDIASSGQFALDDLRSHVRQFRSSNWSRIGCARFEHDDPFQRTDR